MKCKCLKKIATWYDGFFSLATKMVEPFYAFVLRIYLLCEFLPSGWLKVQDIYNGQWSRVVFLFKYEYKVPLLSPEIAAAMGTFNEIVFPILLVVGFMSRFAALALFAMSLIIELTYQHNINHYLWMTMSMYLMLRGPGLLSADYLLHKYWLKNKK